MIDLFDAQSTEVSLFNSLDEPQPKLLLVDDKEANLFATSRLLKALDVEVITATSGAEALSLTLRHDFALVLMDVQMPIMNGFETADYLRENEDTRHVPIIFVTAISKEDRYVNQGYEVGAVDYIFKPIDGPILLAKVSVFLELHKKKLRLKRSLSALQELKQRYLMLLEAASDGIVGVGVGSLMIG